MSAATLPPPARETIDDLMKYDGKAELINGKVLPLMGAGIRHSRLATRICTSLVRVEENEKIGYAFDDDLIYQVHELQSGRESFSPDASFFAGKLSLEDEGCVDGTPTFANEIRSPDDYRPKGLREMTAKRDDYFEAGTIAVWDLDPRAETVTLVVKDQPPQIFRRGELAHAEPAVPGWTMKVDDIFG